MGHSQRPNGGAWVGEYEMEPGNDWTGNQMEPLEPGPSVTLACIQSNGALITRTVSNSGM